METSAWNTGRHVGGKELEVWGLQARSREALEEVVGSWG